MRLGRRQKISVSSYIEELYQFYPIVEMIERGDEREWQSFLDHILDDEQLSDSDRNCILATLIIRIMSHEVPDALHGEKVCPTSYLKTVKI